MSDAADEVDRIVAAWRRTSPDLDVTPLTVFSRVARLARHLELARREAFAGQGLEVWEFDVLTALRRTPGRELSPGALVEQTLSTSGTMTNRVDRLAARGLVERLPDPQDRRGVRVRITAAGAELADAALRGLLDSERATLARLTRAETEALAGLLRRLLGDFEAG